MGIQIEGTPEFQRGFDAVCPDVSGLDPSPYTRTQKEVVTPDSQPRPDETFEVSMTRYIMQSIIAESPYKPDMEWELWHQAHALEETNGLPNGVTAEDIFQAYLRVFHGE